MTGHLACEIVKAGAAILPFDTTLISLELHDLAVPTTIRRDTRPASNRPGVSIHTPVLPLRPGLRPLATPDESARIPRWRPTEPCASPLGHAHVRRAPCQGSHGDFDNGALCT